MSTKMRRLRPGVMLAMLVLLLGLFPSLSSEPVSASPDELKWSAIDTPSEKGKIVTPGEVSAIALGSDGLIFYTIDIPNKQLYKSADGGFTWNDDLNLTHTLIQDGAILPAWNIAVAPDNPDLVAVVTDARGKVFVSWDGGRTWKDSEISTATGWNSTLYISAIVISPKYSEDNIVQWDIAAGTRNPDNSTNGDVWIIKANATKFYGKWRAQNLEIALSDTSANVTYADVTSVRFSPDYATDETILAIASTAGDVDATLANATFLSSGYRTPGEDTTTWLRNSVEIIDLRMDSAGDSPAENEIIGSDLALASGDYSGGTDWVAYAGYYSNTTADDVYRINYHATPQSAELTRLNTTEKGNVTVATPIASIAYADGKLVVGEVLGDKSAGAALIHICSNPEDTGYPPPQWDKPSEPPSGGAISGRANAQLACGGGKIYCGTGTNHVENATAWADMTLPGGPWSGENLDESAFSVSNDDGDTWNQLALINTAIGELTSFALSADTRTLYLASVNRGGFDSLWRSNSDPLGKTWQRILYQPHEGDIIILRTTPKGSPEEALFFAITGTNKMRYSTDQGETWNLVRDCPEITDLAVASSKLFYVLDDNLVSKCWWNAAKWKGRWEWQRDVDTGLIHGYSIAISGTNFVFVGDNGDEGKIAYSSDSGGNFTLTEAVPKPGKMVVIPDEEFDWNRLIYAASDAGGIYRWKIGDVAPWDDLNPEYVGFNSLAQKASVLYASYGQAVARTLVPHAATLTPSDWDRLRLGLPDNVALRSGTLQAIATDDVVNLWALDDHNYDFSQHAGCLWTYRDTFALQTPWPNSPAIGELMTCDVCTCNAQPFVFRWREVPQTNQYEIWIALDEGFTLVIDEIDDITPANLHSPSWSPSADSPRFVCGQTYYWKVRSSSTTGGETIHSPWSPPMQFTVKPCMTEAGNVYIYPILTAPQSGSRDVLRSPAFTWIGFSQTTKYEFILAKDSALTQVVVKEELSQPAYQYQGQLDWGRTYFWQVRALEPVPSEPSSGTFTVMSQPQPTAPTGETTPAWLWPVIGILAALDAVIIAFCIVRR